MEPSAFGTDCTTAAINHQFEKSANLIHDARRPMEGFAATLDGLNSQTIQIALLGEVGTMQEIADLREQMRDQSQKHQDGITKIQGILDNFLQNQVVENMRKQVEREIQSHIDDLVKEHVSECLKDHIPLELQQEVAERKRELEQLNLALHNSESRRANGNLRSTRPDDALATLLMSNGLVSERFPKDLKNLFSLDVATVKMLMNDYELANPSNHNKDHNLNRFMQFCGVRYQLVRPTAPAVMTEKDQ